MKKLFLMTLIICFLVSCSDDTSPATYTLSDIEEVESDTSIITDHYVNNELLPYYAPLSAYPDESILDWQEETDLEVTTGQTLIFSFEEIESLNGLIFVTDSPYSIRLILDDQALVFRNMADRKIQFESSILTQSVKIELLEIGESINEIHLVCDRLMNDVEYTEYLDKQDLLNQLHNIFKWQDSTEDNLDIARHLTEAYQKDYLVMESIQIELAKLTNQHYGYLISLNGQVESVEKVDDYYLVYLKPIGTEASVVVYLERAVEVKKMLKVTGIFINIETSLVFYGLE